MMKIKKKSEVLIKNMFYIIKETIIKNESLLY